MFSMRLLLLGLCFCQLEIHGRADDLCQVETTEKPHIVMLVAEREYETMQSLRSFAGNQEKSYRTTIVVEDPNDRNRLIGLDSLQNADLLLVSVRRRTLPKEQLDLIRRFISRGKPVVGIRTASHAFSLRNKKPPEGRADWPNFDQTVFGGNYTNHHGNDLQVQISVAETELNHPIMKGIDAAVGHSSSSSLYCVSPLMPETKVLIRGQVTGHPSEPIAWTFKRADGGKSFYTSLGNTEDFEGKVLPVLLANAIAWGLSK